MWDLAMWVAMGLVVVMAILFARTLPKMLPSESLLQEDATPLAVLEKTYRGWDFLDLILLLLIPVLSAAGYVVFQLLVNWHTHVLSPYQFVLVPRGTFWLLPGIFLGVLSSYLLIPRLYQLALGPRYRQYLVYKAKKLNVLTALTTNRSEASETADRPVPFQTALSRSQRSPWAGAIQWFGRLVVLAGGVMALYVYAGMDWYTVWTADRIRVNGFWNPWVVEKPYPQVTAILLRSPPPEKGVGQDTLGILFQDRTQWSSDGLAIPQPVFSPPTAALPLSPVADWTAQKSGRPVQTQHHP